MSIQASRRPKIGFFGGTFDPIHLGHLNLAIQIFEIHKLDQLFFCPTSQAPHKNKNPPIASKEQRRAMVAAAIAPIPYFTFLDFEIQKSDPCYTVDTIRQLIAADKEKKKQYYLVLGDDCVEDFMHWKEHQELVKLAPPLIGTRKGKDVASLKKLSQELVSIFKKGLTEINTMEISSTEIRKRIKEKLFCGHLLPPREVEYIEQNTLYV